MAAGPGGLWSSLIQVVVDGTQPGQQAPMMTRARFFLLGELVLCAALLTACSTIGTSRLQQHVGESLVMIGDQPASLAYAPLPEQTVSVRSTYLPGPNTVRYLEGQDFILNLSAGTLTRTPESRIPDFRTNSLFGQDGFDHTKFPGFGNSGYFVFVDYKFRRSERWSHQANAARLLRETSAKLKADKPVKIVAFGDSITAGGDASEPQLIFWERWAGHLRQKYPRSQVTAVNGATGGDSTVQGLERLQNKVLDQKPDLVLIGFGMNDHNVSGVAIPQFEQNLKEMIGRIRQSTRAEVILFSAFPPNPKWKFGTHRMEEYAAATERVAGETRCAYADVFRNWQLLSARKKPEDLLGNNINHPNDFGHWIYYRVLQELGL